MSAALRHPSVSRATGRRGDALLESGIHEVPSGIREACPAPAPVKDPLTNLQDLFIENWARMAGAFAMDQTMGRIHALVYVSVSPVDTIAISERLGLPVAVCEMHIEQLLEYGIIRHEQRNGEQGFVAEQDSWTWFLRILKQRSQREFAPLQQAVRAVREAARQLDESTDPRSMEIRETLKRVERFTAFIDELSSMLEALVNLGAGPMMRVVKTFAKFMPRGRAA